MPIINPKGNEDYWLDAEPYPALGPKVKVQNLDYWIDAAPFEFILPDQGQGNFFMFFY